MPVIPLSRVLTSRFFIAVAVAFLFALGMQVGGIAHVYRLANTRIDAETAAAAVAVLAISSLIGRLVVGWMLLRVGSRTMTFALITVQTVALALLAYAHGAIFVLITTAMFGLTSGSILMMQPLLLVEAFGVRDYGRIYSIGQFVGVFGYAIGPAIMGMLYEASGGYEIAYLAAAAGSLIGMGALALSGPTRQPYGRS